MRRVLAAALLVLWSAVPASSGVAVPAGGSIDDAAADPQREVRLTAELTRTLDRVLAHERPGGGWIFVHAAGRRPEPNTIALRLAERVAAPLGLATWDVVVLRSPGTSAAGLALLAGYRLTGRADYLAAARRAADLVIATQLPTGGWFSEVPVEGSAPSPWFVWSIRRTAVDDDVTTGAIRLLLATWEATGERDYRSAAERGLAFLVRAERPDGAWPLVWRPAWKRAVWWTFEDLATLNDAATSAAVETLALAAQTLGRTDLLAVARRGGDWLVRARRPPPQAGWAQQYDADGAPAPARRFEPAALASWETRFAIEALLALAAATGDTRWCAPIPDAARWLADTALRPGCWARFYALGTNAPIYIDAAGARVATPGAARPGYDWTGEFGIPALLARLGIGGEGGASLRERSAAVGELIAARPIPGDPGVCPGTSSHTSAAAEPEDPRLVIAHAARLLAALTPPPPSPCAR